MLYKILYTESYSKTYTVEAESYEEAREKLENDIYHGNVNTPEEFSGCGYEEVKIEDPMEIIDFYKRNTCYFDRTITEASMYEMFRYRMQFGEAESQVLLAALKIAGAKFKKGENA